MGLHRWTNFGSPEVQWANAGSAAALCDGPAEESLLVLAVKAEMARVNQQQGHYHQDERRRETPVAETRPSVPTRAKR